ncbi:MAG TPA: pyruvate kinase [Planctomycetota bacterium]|nr:pyruvate kinase [Planctomycetota bacterium]
MTSPKSTAGAPSIPGESGRAATKIVATIGPASEGLLLEMIDAGLSVARINFSHGTGEDHRRRIEAVRAAARERDAAIGVLADIQGPKLRLGRLAAGARVLEVDERVRLVEAESSEDPDVLPFNFQGFTGCLKVRDRVLLADAVVELVTESVERGQVVARVRRGGEINDRKGVHLPDSNLTFDLPTPQDREHIALAREMGVDMLGISFVSRAEEIDRIRDLAPDLILVAKIERRVAVENLRSILEAADGLMVARGDLGVEMRLEQLPLVQKEIIHEALRAGKFAITATEMLESMVHASRPTRAEVTDVANAVLDGTDAVMLSAETAVGSFPVESITAMSNIALAVEGSERYRNVDRTSFRSSEPTFSNATAMGAVRVATALGIGKIVCFTESGNTVRLLSRYRTGAEIIALTPSERTLRSMTLLSHVRPMLFPRAASLEEMLHEAQEILLVKGLVLHGEEIIFVAGVPPGVTRSTNVMKLHRIGEATRLH